MRFFRAGVNRDKYWNNDHAKLQLEDFIVCLLEVFPKYDFAFIYNQFSGYKKVGNNGLVYSNMNMSFGGTMRSMHDISIYEVG